LEATSTGLKVVALRASNSCSFVTKYTYVNITGGSSGGGSDPCARTLNLSPNPTSGDITAKVILPPGGGGDPCTTRIGEPVVEEIDKDGRVFIVNQTGEIVFDKKYRGKDVKLKLHKLDPGVYILHYLYNGELLSEKIVFIFLRLIHKICPDQILIWVFISTFYTKTSLYSLIYLKLLYICSPFQKSEKICQKFAN